MKQVSSRIGEGKNPTRSPVHESPWRGQMQQVPWRKWFSPLHETLRYLPKEPPTPTGYAFIFLTPWREFYKEIRDITKPYKQTHWGFYQIRDALLVLRVVESLIQHLVQLILIMGKAAYCCLRPSQYKNVVNPYPLRSFARSLISLVGLVILTPFSLVFGLIKLLIRLCITLKVRYQYKLRKQALPHTSMIIDNPGLLKLLSRIKDLYQYEEQPTGLHYAVLTRNGKLTEQDTDDSDRILVLTIKDAVRKMVKQMKRGQLPFNELTKLTGRRARIIHLGISACAKHLRMTFHSSTCVASY